MNRLSMTALLLTAVHTVWSPQQAGAQELMTKDGPKGFGKTGVQCNGPVECTSSSYSPTDPVCPRCGRFSVALPINAQVKRIECWGTKTLPGPQADWLQDPNKSVQYQGCTQSYDHSDFTQVQQNSNVVNGIFRNWSSGIDRYAEIRVYYTLPKKGKKGKQVKK